ncbi:P-loop containing nucleoside triphosphate hydrolase protein [Pseudovirgaria hyperparasitica]|uniref:ATP-dependent RNA helicase n=1 Tax=Pseudovirgaria hyperparasitica TaxID=470096 RepID=A0A6A6W452_9PEZI|nr:P-loop containing nucleoside triphosphate hydrolase protein [Pseudovirgaria hyperparasitica]KAF2756949.1 P-loop containing nucleoside triphosphate hydrolase protein [Pseudovirgaria hyperparasitica]
MAGQLYARYVPPVATAPVAKLASDDLATQSSATPTSIKKAKDKRKANDTKAKPSLKDEGRDPMQDEHLHTKRKKRAREAEDGKDATRKRLKHPVAEAPNEQQDISRSDKFKAVFSKFERSSRITEAVRGSGRVEIATEAHTSATEPPVELLDLGPIPQPEQPPEVEAKPTFSALPSWLADPIKISSSARTTFSDLHLDDHTVKHLGKLGYDEAFAVQAGLIPLISPGKDKHMGDICVSAATGSGKTLAYMLPMVESLKHSLVTKLRGLVIVPTRELVTQAQKVAEDCAAKTGLKIGTAVGNQVLHDEQRSLVRKRRRYDPDAAKILNDKALQVLKSGSLEEDELLEDCRDMLPGHVPIYESNVDILICTPGRLVDHIRSTRGFHLYDLKWLVIDEADRLLDQSFQDWTEVLMSQLDAQKPEGLLSAYERMLATLDRPKARKDLTKIILSATMTKDLAKLSALRLSRPRLLVVGEEKGGKGGTEQILTDNETFDLPKTLTEYALSVGDGSKKPLYLLHLLSNNVFVDSPAEDQAEASQKKPTSKLPKDSADSSSDEDSSSHEAEDSSGSDSDAKINQHTAPPEDPIAQEARSRPRLIIFTNNNENASRLAHVLGALDSKFAAMTGVLTKSSTTTVGKKVLREFSNGKKSILIASDRASRGLDVPNVTHIINYDIPRSVVSYVHRIGRTARAERSGEACTLFTRTEARWFWHEIAKGSQIRRVDKRKVIRISINLAEHVSDEMKSKYVAALEGLREAVEDRKDVPTS